jgi:hypothetical protein
MLQLYLLRLFVGLSPLHVKFTVRSEVGYAENARSSAEYLLAIIGLGIH